jgi:hypothetical protein
MAEILEALSCQFGIARHVANEAMYVGSSSDADEDREPVDLDPMIRAGLLTVLDLGSPAEFSGFVGFAAELDDGEAATCALAVHRG